MKRRMARLKVSKELLESVLQLPKDIKIVSGASDNLTGWIELVIEDKGKNHLRELGVDEKALPLVKATVKENKPLWTFKEVS